MSLRLRLIGAGLRPLIRFGMARVQDPLKMRRDFDLAARLWFRRVPHALFRKTRFGGDKRPALWVSAGPVHDDRVMLYLHGGGYLAGGPRTHRNLVARLCRMSGMRALLPSYRLAPEHPLPAALQDARAAFDHLVTMGHAPETIVIGGDSAGGGLALALLAELCQQGRAPAACFAWSPFCDQAFTGASVQENAKRDHFFPGDRVHELAAMVLGDLDPRDPRASPLYAQFPNCPPVLLQVSDSEILRDDAHRMAEHLRGFGATVTLQEWSGAPHVWQIFDGWFPEARAAIAATASFLNQMPAPSADS